jgi:hypothetical protein
MLSELQDAFIPRLSSQAMMLTPGDLDSKENIGRLPTSGAISFRKK